MAHQDKVVRSINADGALLCLDIFQRPDGSFGFGQYRRDAEDPRGWFALGHDIDRRFATEAAAMSAARASVAWLDGAIAD